MIKVINPRTVIPRASKLEFILKHGLRSHKRKTATAQ